MESIWGKRGEDRARYDFHWWFVIAREWDSLFHDFMTKLNSLDHESEWPLGYPADRVALLGYGRALMDEWKQAIEEHLATKHDVDVEVIRQAYRNATIGYGSKNFGSETPYPFTQ